MSDQNHIAPAYQEMADLKKERRHTGDAASPTQQQLLEMSEGERWAHEAAQRVDRAGGNQGDFTAAAESDTADFTVAEAGPIGTTTDLSQMPQRIQQGITTRYENTDRRLDYDGEFGYPTPT
jgi:hypothetical protein